MKYIKYNPNPIKHNASEGGASNRSGRYSRNYSGDGKQDLMMELEELKSKIEEMEE